MNSGRREPMKNRIDYQEKGCVLFNHFFNGLGCEDPFYMTMLSLEKCSCIEDLSAKREEQFLENNHMV